jgi:DDE superfamily endonuclease
MDESEEIICVDLSNGKKHDFRLYKESKIYHYSNGILQQADTAYKSKDYPDIITPHKKAPKKRKTKENPKPETTHLSDEQKEFNHALSSKRCRIENKICEIKLFKIHAERYRNRRKKVGLRFNLTCGLINFQKKLRDKG